MPTAAPPRAPDRHIQQLLDRLAVDPHDLAAFRALEEHFFLGGEWSRLAGVYECRIAALAGGSPEWSELMVRLARVLEQRLGAAEAARRRYEELLERSPRHPEALGALRALLARGGDVAAALQIAEIEEQMLTDPHERSRALTQIGRLWRELGDVGEARRRFEQAHALDAGSADALLGLAELLESEGELAQAARLHERRIERLSGAKRTEAMERLARILPDSESERRRTLLREVVREEPNRLSAVELLIEVERAAGELARVAQLQRELFDRLRDRDERARIALAAAALQLDELADVPAALEWTERGVMLAPEEPRLYQLRARIFRKRGEAEALIQALERLEALEGRSAMRLLEIAVLHERRGTLEHAVAALQTLLQVQPDEPEALGVLDRCLLRLGRHGARIPVLQFRFAHARPGEESAAFACELGEAHTAIDDLRGAEAAFREALKHAPAHGPAIERLAALLAKTERFPELGRVLASAADAAQSRELRAERLCALAELRAERLEDEAGARLAYQQALEAWTECERALAGMRALAKSSRDPRLRVEACEHELRQAKDSARRDDLFEEMIRVLLEQQDIPAARRTCGRWCAEASAPGAFRRAAELARLARDLDAEIRALETLEGLLGERPEERAAVAAQLGDLALETTEPDAADRAADWYRESVALAPDPGVRRRLIELYRRAGRLPELAQQLRLLLGELAGAEPERAARGAELARVLLELGDTHGATEQLRPLFELDPSNSELADLYETLLAEQPHHDALLDALVRRLQAERDPARRRDFATRRAELLHDELGRSDDAVAALHEFADPNREERLERLYGRALERSGRRAEQERWLAMRERHVDGEARIELLQKLAQLQHAAGRTREAIETLARAETLSPAARDAVARPLFALVQDAGTPEEKLARLELLLEASGPDPRALAAFRLERARLLVEELSRPEEAGLELSRLAIEGLGTDELRLVSRLAQAAGDTSERLRALERLAALLEPGPERHTARLAVAELRLDGPEGVRDAQAAERELRALLEIDPADARAHALLESLYDRAGRRPELAELLRERLEGSELAAAERLALALREADTRLELDDPAAARRTLEAARARGAGSAALDERLYRSLDLLGDRDAIRALCEQRVRELAPDASGERELWVRRWLEQLAESNDALEARLRAVGELLERAPSDLALAEEHVRLLRALGRSAELADALERMLELGAASLSRARRRTVAWELLNLCEGPLGDSARALGIAEREACDEPALLARGARLAARESNPRLEADFLRALCELHPTPEPDHAQVRRLGLALQASGRPVEAEPYLRRAFATHPRDPEVLSALTPHVQDTAERLALLEAHFALEPRGELAHQALELLGSGGDPARSLLWIRRWASLERLPARLLRRRVELERSVGTPLGALAAIDALLDSDAASEARTRAELLAERARLRGERGDPAGAAHDLREACRLVQPAPPHWLEGRAAALDVLGRQTEHAELLRELSRHAGLPIEARAAYQETRLALMVAHPDLRAQAARELRLLVDAEVGGDRGQTLRRMTQLLELYDALGRDSEWCGLAERVMPLLDSARARSLERELARRLDEALGAHARAAAIFERILERDPHDREAFDRLASLWQAPGNERRRAALLEARARAGDPRAESLFVEAAELYWRALGDPRATLRALDAALALEPRRLAAHQLRSEVCTSTGERSEEQRSLRAVLELDPRGLGASGRWLRLARLALDDPQNWLEAQHAAEQALALAPRPAAVRAEVREVYERVGHFEHALRLLREELRECPAEARPERLRRLARIAWDELGDAPAARGALESLGAEGELLPEDHDRLASALEAQGEIAAALGEREQALRALAGAAPAAAWLELAERWSRELRNTERALCACDRALELDARSAGARTLRAALRSRTGDVAGEVEDLALLASLEPRSTSAAVSLARAAVLAEERLADPIRALALHRAALGRDANCVAALEGVARLSHAAGDGVESAGAAELACALLEGRGEEARRGELALLGAEAALAADARACARRLFELATATARLEAPTLARLGQVALRLECYAEARCAIELRLASDGSLGDAERTELYRRLAGACEADRDLEAAAAALGEALARTPGDEVAHSQRVQLFERLGSPERAVAELDAWSACAPPEYIPELQLHAARLERRALRIEAGRRRLARLVETDRVPADAWVELAELELEIESWEAALAVVERGLPLAEHETRLAALFWVRARALAARGQPTRALEAAQEALAQRPNHLEAARFLAQHFGRASDWQVAVTRLERALDAGVPDRAVEAELWEAVGRAYAGPLEDLERAQHAYRRALDANPLRETAREALADVTSFDPGAHPESARLHRELLRARPTRVGSWRALARIAEHWGRDRARDTASGMLVALGVEREANAPIGCVRTESAADPASASATELLRALEEGEALPVWQERAEPLADAWLDTRVRAIAGPAWGLSDALLEALWRRTVDERAPQREELPRRLRRRIQKAAAELAEHDSFGAERWRASLLAQGSAQALEAGDVGLVAALDTLLRSWPSTRERNFSAVSNPGVLLEDCPPARELLARIADATIDHLGLL